MPLNGLLTLRRKMSLGYQKEVNIRSHFGKEDIDKVLGKNSHQTFKCIYTNLDGLANKIAEFEMLINEEDPDIVLLTETKCNKEMLNSSLFNMAKYTVVRKDREAQNAPGGGVVLLIKKHFCVDENSVYGLTDHNAQESVWCELKSREGKNIILGTIYRTPSSSVENNDLICDLVRLSENSTNDKQLLVCGDFNFGNILWEENRVVDGSRDHGQACKFLEIVQDNFWTQNVCDWTHLRETDNPSRLDLIFTKTSCEVGDIKYLAPLGRSKHAVLCFTLAADSKPKEHEEDTWRLNYHKADKEKMRDLFSQMDWKHMFRDKAASEKWESFREEYNRIVKMCVPTYRRRQGFIKAKWINRRVQMLIKKKQEAWRKYRARKSVSHHDKYNSARNLVTREVRKAKYDYERKVALDSVSNTKHFWAYVRSKTTAKETVTRLKTMDGEVTENETEIAQGMNKAFNRVFVREDNNRRIPTPDSTFQGPRITNINLTRKGVKKRLKKLKGNKAPGPDGVSPQVLKDCCDILCDPLLDIFQTSLDTGDVPDDWRRANISPIYKKGSKLDPLNYRPVSLTSIGSKVLESIIREEIVRHLIKHKLITNAQHGFRNRRSCLTNMLCYLDDLIDSLDNGHCTDINYLDCEKAFDRVPHQRLFMKLEAVGLDGNILGWIKGFLTERYHRVNIRSAKSDWLPVESGVPQGSVLGPVLFLVYINDLCQNLESTASLFADDAKIYRTIRTEADVEALQRDMKRLDDWSDKWLLSFNVGKCKTMHIGHNNQQADYQLKGNTLQKTTQEKDLGIIVSNNLKSSEHVATVAAKANSRLGVIKRNFSVLTKEILVPLYLSLVRPIMDYAAQSWSPYLKKDIQVLEKVQRRATKLVPDLTQLPYEERCKRLGLQTLEDRRNRGDMIETYKLLHGYEDIPYAKFFQLNTNNLRGHSLKLSRPEHWRTTLKGNWFTIRVIDKWNALPESVVTAPTIATFKSRYDRHIGLT